MAGTERQGGFVLGAPDTLPFLTGISNGRYNFVQRSLGAPLPVLSPFDTFNVGPNNVVTKTPGSKTVTSHVGGLIPVPPGPFYEEVHILPRAKIEFGTIVTQTDEDYEIYNAYRSADVTLNTITNNLTPGIETPNVSAPVAIPSQTSILDTTTTDNSAGTGLGTIVKAKLRALLTGLPTFDGTVDFAFSTGGTIYLYASGTRVTLLPFQYEAPVSEMLAFLTQVIPASSGKEQRISLRENPRQLFKTKYLLDSTERQRFQNRLMNGTAGSFGLPLWVDVIKTTVLASIGTSVYQVTGADEIDLRVGGLAAIIHPDGVTSDVINIVSFTATSVTAQDVSLNAYPIGSTLMPVRVVNVLKSTTGKRYPKNLEEFSVEYQCSDNDTGALAGDTSGFSSYATRVLLDDCNVVNGTVAEKFERRLHIIDNSTGTVSVRSPWDRFKRTHTKSFVARNRAEILSLRKLLIALRGKQTAFWIPTFFDDVTVVVDLTSGVATMDITHIDYTTQAQSREPKRILKISFTDGTSLVRVVASSAIVSATVERLTMTATWPANRTVAEIDQVEFYELSRFDSDSFLFMYPRIGLASVSVPVKAVFDDN